MNLENRKSAVRSCAKAPLQFLWLELTARCNLDCIHCYSESGPGSQLEGAMMQTDWQRVLEEGRDLGCECVQFIGGEVLLVPYLLKLISFAREVGFSVVEVFSNSTILDDSTIAAFQNAGVCVATSFYCHDSDIHECITNRQGSWRRTLSAIDLLVLRCVPLRVGVIEMEVNRPFVPETIKFLKDRGVTNVRVDRVRSFGRAAAFSPNVSGLTELCGNCGDRRVCVTGSGKVFPCIMSRHFPIGNFLESGLRAAVEGAQLKEFRTSLVAVTRGCAPCDPHACGPNDCAPGAIDCDPDHDCFPERKFPNGQPEVSTMSSCQRKNGKTARTIVPRACEPSTGEECSPDYCAPDFCCEPNESQPPDPS
jgi:MoaA/NifB/PqqE/SkfB family radical SAM enzyme